LVRPWSHQNVGRQLIGQAMITLKCHLSALEISYPFEELCQGCVSLFTNPFFRIYRFAGSIFDNELESQIDAI
jgi:hypothetical protein